MAPRQAQPPAFTPNQCSKYSWQTDRHPINFPAEHSPPPYPAKQRIKWKACRARLPTCPPVHHPPVCLPACLEDVSAGHHECCLLYKKHWSITREDKCGLSFAMDNKGPAAADPQRPSCQRELAAEEDADLREGHRASPALDPHFKNPNLAGEKG